MGKGSHVPLTYDKFEHSAIRRLILILNLLQESTVQEWFA